MKIAVFWFRRDLRLEDNTALIQALNGPYKVLPIFIFDKNIISELDKHDGRISFIHESLDSINKQLKKYGRCIRSWLFQHSPIKRFFHLSLKHPGLLQQQQGEQPAFEEQ